MIHDTQPITCHSSITERQNLSHVLSLNYLPISYKHGIFWGESLATGDTFETENTSMNSHDSASNLSIPSHKTHTVTRQLFHMPATEYQPQLSYDITRLSLPEYSQVLSLHLTQTTDNQDTTLPLELLLAHEDNETFYLSRKEISSGGDIASWSLPSFLWADEITLRMQSSLFILHGYTDSLVWASWDNHLQADSPQTPSHIIRHTLDAHYRYAGFSENTHFFIKIVANTSQTTSMLHIRKIHHKTQEISDIKPISLPHIPKHSAYYIVSKNQIFFAFFNKHTSTETHPYQLQFAQIDLRSSNIHMLEPMHISGDYQGDLQFFQQENKLYAMHFSWMSDKKILNIYPLSHRFHDVQLPTQHTFGTWNISSVITEILPPINKHKDTESSSTMHMLVRTGDNPIDRKYAVCTLTLPTTRHLSR